MNELILVVDDEYQIVKLARDYLEKGGYRVLTAEDGESALAAFRSDKPDLVVLDLNLPKMDGLDVCRAIRRTSDAPIIMLTARVEETDRLIGLEIGADDYITKPFSPRELVARVRVVLRRVQGLVSTSGVIKIGDLEIDTKGHCLTRAGEEISLSRTEFNLLVALASYPGQTMERAQLLTHLYGYTGGGYDRSVDAHIKNLRRKLEPNPAEPKYVLTVYGVGYKFNDRL